MAGQGELPKRDGESAKVFKAGPRKVLRESNVAVPSICIAAGGGSGGEETTLGGQVQSLKSGDDVGRGAKTAATRVDGGRGGGGIATTFLSAAAVSSSLPRQERRWSECCHDSSAADGWSDGRNITAGGGGGGGGGACETVDSCSDAAIVEDSQDHVTWGPTAITRSRDDSVLSRRFAVSPNDSAVISRARKLEVLMGLPGPAALRLSLLQKAGESGLYNELIRGIARLKRSLPVKKLTRKGSKKKRSVKLHGDQIIVFGSTMRLSDHSVPFYQIQNVAIGKPDLEIDGDQNCFLKLTTTVRAFSFIFTDSAAARMFQQVIHLFRGEGHALYDLSVKGSVDIFQHALGPRKVAYSL